MGKGGGETEGDTNEEEGEGKDGEWRGGEGREREEREVEAKGSDGWSGFLRNETRSAITAMATKKLHTGRRAGTTAGRPRSQGGRPLGMGRETSSYLEESDCGPLRPDG